jgi:chemotaxis protein CheD
MELLVNEMLKLGALKSRMKARLYGGANMAPGLGVSGPGGLGRIGSANAAFARRFLRDEGIATVFEDLEGGWARRIEFNPVRGLVRARRVAAAMTPELAPPVPPRAAAATGNSQGTAQAPIGDVELF